MERFMELYGAVYQDMYRLAFYYMGNAEDAEDAVQDAALSACEHFGGLKKEEAFRAWIFQILVNKCRKMLRKRGRQESVSELPEPFGEKDPNLELRTELLELLSGLEEEERLIVVMTVFGGYKGEEIAKALGRKHSTVRSRYRRALKKLEKMLEREEKERTAGKEA